MDKASFRLDFSVRDYECDIGGIVNNAVYLNYLEHTRHEYLKSVSIDFAALALQGVDLIVVRSEVDYRFPLRSGDAFYITSEMERASKIRFQFVQNIYRLSDDKNIVNAKFIATSMNKKRAAIYAERIIGCIA